MADAFTAENPQKPRFVLGSVGPTSQICSPEAANGHPLEPELLRQAYDEQMRALIEGGVDGLLIETIFDLQNARVAIDAAMSAMRQTGRSLPLLLSFSVATPDGHNMLGQSIPHFVESLKGMPIYSVGLNCLTEVGAFIPLLQRLSRLVPFRLSLYPNAGHPDADGLYPTSPEQLLKDVWPLLDAHQLNIIGVCCGTTDAHIQCFARAVQPVPGVFLSPYHPGEHKGTHLQKMEDPSSISSIDRQIIRSVQSPTGEPEATFLFDAI